MFLSAFLVDVPPLEHQPSEGRLETTDSPQNLLITIQVRNSRVQLHFKQQLEKK